LRREEVGVRLTFEEMLQQVSLADPAAAVEKGELSVRSFPALC